MKTQAVTLRLRLRALQGLAAGQQTSVEIVGEPWSDDHILCCDVRITLPNQPAIKVELMWIGWEGIAALRYANDSASARADVAKHLGSAIEGLEEEIEQEESKP